MTDTISPAQAFAADPLVELLDLEAVEQNLFRTRRTGQPGHRLFGGEVCAQALVAAERTSRPASVPHSLHAYFLRPGDTGTPVVFTVERPHDGRTFQRRRVTAIQHGKPILSLDASFTTDQTGTDHQVPAPEGPPAEECPSISHLCPPGWAVNPSEVFDVRTVHMPGVVRKSAHDMWFRPRADSTREGASPAALLTYFSDYLFVSAVLRPAPKRTASLTSLDHMIWFHNPVRLDDWQYYAKSTPAAGPLRGLAEGRIFHQDGTLIATIAQEGLIQPRS